MHTMLVAGAVAAQTPRVPSLPIVHPFANTQLTESSALAASRRQPGVLWTLNDSGNPAQLFATDTLGRDLGTFDVSGASNVDWEDLSLGPCGTMDCVYIGDIGDNRERRKELSLYRVSEPVALGRAGSAVTAPTQRLRFRYPDGSHDAEALVVDSTGDAWLITKGRTGGVGLYRLPARAWTDRSAVTTAIAVQHLPLPVSSTVLDLVTGASLRPDGRAIVIRTYLDAFIATWSTSGSSGGKRIGPLQRCDLRRLFANQMQSEGIAWLPGDIFGLSSEEREGKPASIVTTRCQLDPLR